MKLNTILLTLIIAFISGCAFAEASASENRVFKPGGIFPDTDGVHINAHGPGMLYYDNTYYWFGEHKIQGRAGNKAHVGVRCYASKDLYNWKNEGVALSVVKDDKRHEITQGCVLERPKVIYNAKTKKFVMWFHLEFKDAGYLTARTGVATSDSPAGPYTYLYSFRPNAGQWPINVTDADKKLPPKNLLGRDHIGGQMARDMTLFVDDDQKAYHFYASEDNGTMHISQLTDDYLRPSGKYKRLFIGRYMEAPAVFKHKGKYYFIASDCTGWAPNAARSASADSIWGPWIELGNPCIGPNAEKTFNAQSTYVLPVAGKDGCFIFMADSWRPQNAIDGRYVWLPVKFTKDDKLILQWSEKWDLTIFDKLNN